MILKILLTISCIFNHTRYINVRKLGSHIELPTENDKNLYMLTKLLDGTLIKMNTDGFDTRYNTIEPLIINTLSFCLLKNHVLQLLNDTRTDIHTKIQIIQDFDFLLDMDTLSPNIITDDLLDDWNFEI